MAIRETIKLDNTDYKRTVRETEQVTKRMGKTSQRAVEESSSKISKGFKKIGTAAKLWIAGIAFGAFRLLRKGLDLTQEIEETASKFDTVLGPSVDKANKFLEENATLMGLSNTQAKGMVATTTAIAQGFGFQGEAAANLGMEVVKLAGDLQSFNDVPIERTHNAITTALSGEREALKTLGIVIRETEVQERALANTGKDTADALSQQEKATATLQLITERAGKAVGDLERTQASASNRRRQVMAEIRNIAELLSMRLMPALTAGLSALEPVVATLKEWVEVPLSEEIKQEQTALNVLVSRITDTNTSQKERNRLIGELKREYPDFLKDLDAEKVTNEQLATRLGKVNQLYVKRIALQAQQERIEKAISEQTAIMRDKIQLENQARQKAIELIDRYGLNVKTTGVSL